LGFPGRRMNVLSLFAGIGGLSCDSQCGVERRANVIRPLTRSLDLTEEGLAMNATQHSDSDA
jgi:hypothetical protein